MAKANKWIILRTRTVWVLLILLVPSFILFFHASGRSPFGRDEVAGTLFGRSVSQERFQQQRAWVMAKLRDHLKGLPAEFLAPMIEQEVWRELLLLEEARREHRRTSDEELAAFLRTIPAFQREGRFDAERYHTLLRAQQMDPGAFEELIRGDLTVESLVKAVTASVSVTDDEVNAAYARAHERLTAGVVVFESASFAEPAAAAVTDAQVHARYDAHPEEVRVPERIRFEFLGRTREDVRAHAPPSDEALQTFYDRHQAEFITDDGAPIPFAQAKDQVTARLTEADAGSQLTALALDVGEDLKRPLRFEELALKHGLPIRAVGPVNASDSSLAGGPEPAVLKALRGLPEGGMSDVIETDDGVYVARVTQRLPARVPPFEEVREMLRRRVAQERARADAQAAADAFRERLLSRQREGWRIEETLLAEPPAGGTIRTVSLSREGPIEGLGDAPEVTRAAFDSTLGALTSVLSTPTGFVIVRPEERFPAEMAQFANDEAQLREQTLTEKQRTHLTQWMTDLRTRANLKTSEGPLPP